MDEALAWPTPTAVNHRSIYASEETHDKNARPLQEFVGRWGQASARPTPQTFDATDLQRSPEARARAMESGGCANLREIAVLWPTPALTDSNGARNRTSGRSNPESHHHDGVTLNDAIRLYSLPDPGTQTDGEESSRESRTLNPLFVEWLMGWPLAWTDFACSATELSRFKQRMRFALSQLDSPAEAPPAQLALFG